MRANAAIRRRNEWDGERCVHPPWHAGGTVCLLRPDATLVGRAQNGALRWRTEPLGPPPRVLSARSGGNVFGDHLLVAVEEVCLWVNVENGNVEWRRAPWERGIREMARTKDRVFDYGVEGRGGPAYVFALQLSTGGEERLFSRPEAGRTLVADERRLTVLEQETCMGLELATGGELWSVSLERPSRRPEVPGRLVGAPAIVRDLALFGWSGYGAIAVRYTTGEVAWECTWDVGGIANLAVHGEHAHLLTAVDYTKIRLSDGAIVQQENLIPLLRPLGIGNVGLPAFHDDLIIAVGSQGVAFAYDASANRLTWHVDVAAEVPYACPPAVAHRQLWIMDRSGRLHVFEIST